MSRFKIIFLLFSTFLFAASSNSGKQNFKIIDDNSNATKILFTLDDSEIIKNENKHEFKTNDNIGLTMDTGHPQLPIFSTLFKINPDKNYDISYNVISSHTVENIDFKNYEDNSLNSNSIYPQENMYVSEPQIMRDLVLNQVGFIPYKYFPEQKKLEIYELVEINIVESGDSNFDYFLPQKKSRVFSELYQNSIINYTPSDRDEDYQIPSILYICGGGSCSNSWFLDLVEWRHKQGYHVTVATTSSSDDDGLNGSNESSINNYIESSYYGVNSPEIVALVGDVGGSYNIACDYYEWGDSWWGYQGASDVRYTYITGNDLLPEIVIGRISADNSSDLANIINKTIQYEKGNFQSDNWFERAALIGDPTVGSGVSPAITCQWIKELMLQFGVENVLADLNGGGNALSDFLVDQFNAGILYYNYRGIYEAPGCYLTNSMINSMNNGYNTPFATIITCGTGDFDYDDDSEEFIRIGSVTNPKGAVACVGMSTTGTHTAYNNIIDMGIYDGIFSKNLSYGGSAVTNGRIAIYETYPSNPGDCVGAFSAYCNLMGDPSLHLWTDTPKDFNIDIPSEMPLGSNHFDLIVRDSEGNVVEDARVTLLLGDDDIFETGYTDSEGFIAFNWNNNSQGELYVTVTKKNYRPSENSIQITDDYAIDINWDGNLEANPGENYTFPMININSIGNDNISWISGELNSNSDLVEIVSGNTSWIYMTPDDWMGNQEPLIINISENAIYGDDINLILNLTDNHDNNWSIYIPFSINSPKIDILEFLIADDIESGSSLEAFLQLQNNGNLASNQVNVDILSNSYLVNIENGNISFEYIAPDQIAISAEPISISFSNSISNGSIFPIEIKVTDSDNYQRSEFINLTVGEVENTDPLGPDTYGYYIYDIFDTGYDLAPEFNWIELDPEYNQDVVSQDLNLSDGGNGNNATYSIETINLPFPFKFYGDEYFQITISTNGWIVFGDTDALSFRNYSVPGAGGPSPMLAAFWDDMKTTSSGDVFYASYDENNDGLEDLIIEWSDMRTQDNNSEEDFQVILYQGNNSETGDGEIKVQYKEFNNTSNGYYPEGGTPQHGCYVTIGIENKYANEGLEYTFNNIYSQGASVLGDRTAIFITTTSPFVLYGDVNGDEILNILDVVILVNMVLGGDAQDTVGDMNQDGILNILDVVILVGIVLGN